MDTETEKFKECCKRLLKDNIQITDTKESVMGFLEELESNTSNCKNVQVCGKYDFLSAFACLEYLNYKVVTSDMFEDELCELGLVYATRAISVCDDYEYRLLYNMFRIINVVPENGVDAIAELQQLISGCAAIANLHLQKTIIPIYEWEDISEDVMYCKLLTMYERFEDLNDQVKVLLSYDFESSVYKEYIYHLVSNIFYCMEDYSKSFEYAKAVVELGDSDEGENEEPSKPWLDSLVDLGGCYEEGEGVEKDVEKAFELYNRAARLGSGYAMACIGEMYENGIYVELDREMAYSWYNKAVAAGFEDAQEDVDRLK